MSWQLLTWRNEKNNKIKEAIHNKPRREAFQARKVIPAWQFNHRHRRHKLLLAVASQLQSRRLPRESTVAAWKVGIASRPPVISQSTPRAQAENTFSNPPITSSFARSSSNNCFRRVSIHSVFDLTILLHPHQLSRNCQVITGCERLLLNQSRFTPFSSVQFLLLFDDLQRYFLYF